MDRETKLNFYEKLYYHELERREAIERRLRLPFAIFAIVFGLGFFLLKQTQNYPSTEVGILFWTLFSGAAVALVLSIVFFIFAFYSYTYRVLPNAIELENYYKDTLDHYRKSKNGKATEWTKEAFYDYLLEKYQEYASYNAYKNDRKSYRLYISTNFLILSFVLVCTSYYPFIVHLLQS